jgi:hypothetical protein
MAARSFRFPSIFVAAAFIVGCSHCCPRSCCHCCCQGNGCTASTSEKISDKLPAKSPLKPMPSTSDKDAAEIEKESKPAASRDENTARLPPPSDEAVVSLGHARDYSSITGELKHYEISNVWRLRYSESDEQDRYNGSVTLMGAGTLSKFKNGQVVHVTGHLADAESSAPNPVYVVDSIQPVSASR